MDSSPPPPTKFQKNITIFSKNTPKTESDQTTFPFKTMSNRSSGRTPSLSSSSSSSLSSISSPSSSPLSTKSHTTPLRFFGKPFSWEKIPGIPKKIENHNKNQSTTHLPPPLMPPPFTPPGSKKHPFEDSSKKKLWSQSFRMDPFFAALMECSKDDDDDGDDDEGGATTTTARGGGGGIWGGAKITRSISDRFGFVNLYGSSCKKTCSVSDTIIPKSNRASIGIMNRHRS